MLNIVLEILSILGVLLLCLLGLAALLILLALFFPISYKLTGKKDAEETAVSARALWLFGLLRVTFDYPEPGKLLVKILSFTVFDSGREKKKSPGGSEEKARKQDEPEKARKKGGAEKEQKQDGSEKEQKQDGSEKELKKGGSEKEPKQGGSEKEQAAAQKTASKVTGDSPSGTDGGEPEPSETDSATSENTEAADEPSDSLKEGRTEDDTDSSFFKKIKKIKYTICSIYDKIKNIWENISYYIELLQEEETKQLFSHVIFRLGKIWRSIRPRRIRGQILFGTGSPDTTGYAYGVYGMLSPSLGSRLLVTPDFTRAVLEGDIFISGHITVFTILWNGLRVLLDKNLRRFIKKMKAGRKK